MYSYTRSYSILEVASATYADIRHRLQKEKTLDAYTFDHEKHGELIVFGNVALKPSSAKLMYNEDEIINFFSGKVKWHCKRCDKDVIDGRCECLESPSPWEPVEL